MAGPLLPVGATGEVPRVVASRVVIARGDAVSVISVSPQLRFSAPPRPFGVVMPLAHLHEPVSAANRAVIDRLDALTAPRVLQLWERDPCLADAPPPKSAAPTPSRARTDLVFGEYAETKTLHGEKALRDWIAEHGWSAPDALARYADLDFAVAVIDAKKLAPKEGLVTLPPLRAAFDDDARLTVDLGGVTGEDVTIVVLSEKGRFVPAAPPQLTLPTNVDVRESVLAHPHAFGAAMFEHARQGASAAITEFAGLVSLGGGELGLSAEDVATLGAEASALKPSKDDLVEPGPPPAVVTASVTSTTAPLGDANALVARNVWRLRACASKALAADPLAVDAGTFVDVRVSFDAKGVGETATVVASGKMPSGLSSCAATGLRALKLTTAGAATITVHAAFAPGEPKPVGTLYEGTMPSFVATRLHLRATTTTTALELVSAPPIAATDGEHGAHPAAANAFATRYAIRHAWTGSIACEHPVRGRWETRVEAAPIALIATEHAAPIDLTQDVVDMAALAPPKAKEPAQPTIAPRRSCHCEMGRSARAPWTPLALFALAIGARRALRPCWGAAPRRRA